MFSARFSPFRVAILAAALIWSLNGAQAVAACRTDRPGPGTLAIDLDTAIDANNIAMCLSNLGLFACGRGGPGLEYPRGSGHHCVFASGLWVAAKVDGGLRVAIGCYTPEYKPGCIYPDGSYDLDSEPRHRVYKLVRGDTLSEDYANWPSDLGAPVNAQGKPMLTGEQTLWCVYHDANPMGHIAPEGSTAPLCIEVQQTAYAFGWSVAFGNVVYMEFKIINDSEAALDSAYVGLFCDPDIGGFVDDLVGCDPSMNIGFAYNGTNSDEDYGAQPPALGIALLRSPRGMTAFRGYSNGGDPLSPRACYNCLKGLDLDGSVIVNPATNDPTTFQFGGDPVAGTGWLDSDPDDRRFILSSGPFTMAPGDTEQIAIAFVAAKSRNRLGAVRAMKQSAVAAREAFEAGFVGQFLPTTESAIIDGPLKGPSGGNDIPLELGSPAGSTPAIGSRYPLAVEPNPAFGQASIQVRPYSPGIYELTIVDMAGRVVRNLATEVSAEGRALAWDGLNQEGVPVPPGVYSVRLSGAGQTWSAKAVLLR